MKSDRPLLINSKGDETESSPPKYRKEVQNAINRNLEAIVPNSSNQKNFVSVKETKPKSQTQHMKVTPLVEKSHVTI